MNESAAIKSVNQIIENLKQKNIAHLYSEDDSLENNFLTIGGELKINFGSCSYLGLEFDDRLKKGAIDAVLSQGTQFSASRAYVSSSLYKILEDKLEQIFQNPVVVTPTTTLGHIAAIPVLIDKKDVILIDHQVHSSVQNAVKLLKADGAQVEMIRHNRMDLLEKRIQELKSTGKKIWYLGDGIYSMFGDFAPIKKIEELLNKYEEFYYYVDDAHGMSCFGKRGQGYVLSKIQQHERMVVTTSFAKAFATGGGAIILPSQEMADRIRNCGGPLITSGPMQPSALGAAVASADIHLSKEIETIQNRLKQNIQYTQLLLKKTDLPIISEPGSSIFFIGAGLPKVGNKIVEQLVEFGFMVNIGIFPAVPMKNTGVRFTITALHTFEQIMNLVSTLEEVYFKTLNEEEVSLDSIKKAFNLKDKTKIEKMESKVARKVTLSSYLVNSIIDVDKESWDKNLGKRGIFDWNGMNVIENAFKNNQKKEDNWRFFYLTIKDSADKIVLQTFLSSGIMKDDMLSPKEISQDLKKLRLGDPYFYTSKFLMVGSLITEGNHLFIDEQHALKKEALKMLFTEIEKLQKKENATSLMIRDLKTDDEQMDDVMVDNGYFKSEMPENFTLDISNWNPSESFKTQLSKRSKRHYKENIEKFENSFIVEHQAVLNRLELKKVYQLYSNVFEGSDEIATFKIPFKFFELMAKNKNWNVVTLRLKNNPNEIVGAVCSYTGLETYSGVLVGLDYKVNYEYCVYRQLINQLIIHAKSLNLNQINFGFSAGTEKRKFGAVGKSTVAYIQVKDNFKFEALLTENRSHDRIKTKV